MKPSQRQQTAQNHRFTISKILSPICCLVLLLLPQATRSFLSSELSSTSIRSKTKRNAYFRFYVVTEEDGGTIPYLVEPISRTPNEKIYTEIADMCINVFFKEQLGAKPEDKIAPWKEAQIKSLKALQTADLQRRRKLYPRTNQMFLAYKVEPAVSAAENPLILDSDAIQNLPSTEEGLEYVRGEVIGFVEITQKPYGLGAGKGKVIYDDEPVPPMRPILTNLAVKKEVRKYGVGSKLLDACEEHVQNSWEMGEIVLEVEDYNTGALHFYANREFDSLYDDPASRRYDVGGLVLRKVRCTRRIMRKQLAKLESESDSDSDGKDGTVTIDADFFNRKKSSISG